MSTPITQNSTFQDGISAVTDAVVVDLNNSVSYLYVDDNIGESGVHVEHSDPAGQALGSHTQATGRFAGSITLQLVNATDAQPRPGHVLSFRSKHYVVSGDIGPSFSKNNVVRIKPPVTQPINPVISSLLSSDGQFLATSKAGANSTVENTAVNTRNGGSLAWGLAAWTEEYPAAVVPSGLTINASTGVITLASVAAGTYQLKVTVTETLANKPSRTGVGFLILTATS